MNTSGPGGATGRIYFAHYASYIFYEDQIVLSGEGEDYLKFRVGSVTWKKDMAWDRLGILRELSRLAKQQ
jgi:hypothetical protein